MLVRKEPFESVSRAWHHETLRNCDALPEQQCYQIDASKSNAGNQATLVNCGLSQRMIRGCPYLRNNAVIRITQAWRG